MQYKTKERKIFFHYAVNLNISDFLIVTIEYNFIPQGRFFECFVLKYNIISYDLNSNPIRSSEVLFVLMHREIRILGEKVRREVLFDSRFHRKSPRPREHHRIAH